MGLAGLGFSLGFERLHYVLENAFDGDELSYRFKKVNLVRVHVVLFRVLYSAACISNASLAFPIILQGV